MSHFPLHQCYCLAESFLLLPVNQMYLKQRANNLWRTCLHKRPHYTSICCTWRFLMWQSIQRPQISMDFPMKKLTDGMSDVIFKFKTTELRHYNMWLYIWTLRIWMLNRFRHYSMSYGYFINVFYAAKCM